MMYIWAWQAAEFAPERLSSSRMMLASVIPSPAPPYSSGIRQASQPASVSARTNASGYSWRWSTSRQYASGKSLQMSRIAARIASCCCVRSSWRVAIARPPIARMIPLSVPAKAGALLVEIPVSI